MTSKRQIAEQAILELVTDLTNDEDNANIYKKQFAGMNDEQFTKWMEAMVKGDEWLTIWAPPYSKPKLDLSRTFNVADKYKVPLYDELHVSNKALGIDYKTTKALCLRLQVRRASQIGSGKQSVTQNSYKTDGLTGQVVGDSQASAISTNEMMVLASSGAEDSIIELMAVRGGDQGALAAMEALLISDGQASLRTVQEHATGVQSTTTLGVFLTGMHLTSNI